MLLHFREDPWESGSDISMGNGWPLQCDGRCEEREFDGGGKGKRERSPSSRISGIVGLEECSRVTEVEGGEVGSWGIKEVGKALGRKKNIRWE